MEKIINEKKLVLVRGDITDMAVDAIVNAANSRLQLGRGWRDQDKGWAEYSAGVRPDRADPGGRGGRNGRR